jgi:hypothetical protein
LTEVAQTLPLRIQQPQSGQTFTPTALTLSGTASPQSLILILAKGEVVGETRAQADGTWSFRYTPVGEGTVDIKAQALDDTGAVLAESNRVRVTFAAAVAPATGADLRADPQTRERALNGLLALLLTAGGFTLFFIGRALYMRTR